MLLLVVQAKLDQVADLWPDRLVRRFDQAEHGRIHMGAIGEHLRRGGAGDQTALGARVPLAHRLVIGVEQVGVPVVERRISRQRWGEQKHLEEPGRVRQMPFGGTGVGHGLDLLILGR